MLVREGVVEHLGRAHGRAGVADQRMRHGADAARRAEPVRGGVVGVADETLGAFLARRGAADRGGVGHHVLHLGAGAVARLHRQERDLGQGEAHLVGVVRGHAGRAELLEHDRLEVRQRDEAAGDVDDRLAGADPAAFGIVHVEVELGAARDAPPSPAIRASASARRSPGGAGKPRRLPACRRSVRRPAGCG